MKHCWKDYRTHLEESGRLYSAEWAATYTDRNKTCLLPDGHSGPHEWTDDERISVTFAPDSNKAA